MPNSPSVFKANTWGASAQPWGGIRSGLIGLFILTCLVLPGLIWLPHEQPVTLLVRTTEATDAWMEFFDPQFATVEFTAALPLDVCMGLVRVWPDEAAGDAQVGPFAQMDWLWQLPKVERRLLLEGQLTPSRRLIDKGQLNYKVTPSFNFENRELQLSGVVIRLWINF